MILAALQALIVAALQRMAVADLRDVLVHALVTLEIQRTVAAAGHKVVGVEATLTGAIQRMAVAVEQHLHKT